MPIKKNPRGRHYSAARKKHILEVAAKEKLTGEQVRKRFGVSTLTFYRWRGPVRGRRRAKGALVSALSEKDMAKARQQVQAELRRKLPRIIQEEIAAYLKEALG